MTALGIGAFVTCNQLGVHSQSVNGKPKSSLKVKSFVANLPRLHTYARSRSRICALIDIHTLVTHNDTIIFVSLIEGLTYSLRAQHAETVCHKKDCCVGGKSKTIFNRNFTYRFITTDFQFYPNNLTFNLLYIQKALSVRVAIVFIIRFNFNYGNMPKSI